MSVLQLFALVLFSFGALAFGLTFAGFVTDFIRSGRFGRSQSRCSMHSRLVDGGLTFACFAWFVLNTLLELAPLRTGFHSWSLWIAMLFVCFLFPPLIMHDTYTSVEPRNRPGHPLWKLCIVLMYPLSLGVVALLAASGAGWVALDWRELQPWVNAAIPVMFIASAVFATLFVAKGQRSPQTAEGRRARRGHILVLVLMALVFVPLLLHTWAGVAYTEWFSVLSRALPLAFLFAFTYSESRFAFYDVIIKSGAVMLMTLAVTTGGFALALPWLDELQVGWARPWVYAIVLLPLALALPWLSRRLGQWMDQVWLGRTFSADEAVQHMLAGLRPATTEAELVERGEASLREIFRAPARIELGLRDATADFEPSVEAAVRAGDETVGAIRMGRRENDVPYFSQDTALVHSLAGVFSSLLLTVRLQDRKREQEKLAQELSLEASRSELKALRAQINPHFLFNALNAIAGLIHKDPLWADRAVEQLAEVFRYTLRGSEQEWTPLEQEMEFVRAYLEVEQARFGSRLSVRIDIDERVDELWIPTMLLHTLVENAIKHGVAAVRGQGRIDITARQEGGELALTVGDNGPGFGPTGAPDDGGGYGLGNVRARLQGHFGSAARLSIDSDDHATRVTIHFPLEQLRRPPTDVERLRGQRR